MDLLPVPGRIKTYLNTPFYYSEQVILSSVFSLSPSYPFVFCIVDKGQGSKLTIRLRTSMLKRKYVIIPAKTGEQNAKLENKMQNWIAKCKNWRAKCETPLEAPKWVQAYMQKTCDVAEKAILAKKNLRKKCVNRDKM